MPRILLRTAFAASIVCATLNGCADPARQIAGPQTVKPSATVITLGPPDLDVIGLTNEYGAAASIDSADGNFQPLYASVDIPAATCRDHFKSISLYWTSPNGIVTFDLNPPLLFLAYRGGSYLGALKVIYENIGDVDGTNAAGDTYRFNGRFNALCRNFDRKVGPILIEAQILTAQDPIDTPRLVSYGDGSDDGGGTGSCDYQIISDPSTCTDPGGGGGGGGDGGGAPPSVGGGGIDLCHDLQLDAGCYDVYVDDEYDSTICC